MSELTDLGVAAIREGVAKGDFTAVEVAGAFNAAVAEAQPALNAFITLTPEKALEAAAAVDADRAAGKALGKMAGVPIGMKDLFATTGTKTTAASNILGTFVPPYESTVSQKLWDAGAGMLGKLNLDQFAMGSSNETSAFGNVISPWRREGSDAQMAPGGSSGGSSAAVSARIAPAATGTDTGGSIRQPAAFTGISGIKPTYGRCSRWGIVAFASSLDQAGPMARDVRDCAIMLEAMAGFDPKDSTSLDMPVPEWEASLNADLRGKKVGIPREYRMDGMDADVARVWDEGIAWLKDAGAEIVDINLAHTKYALPAYYIIAPAEASSNLARYDGVRYGLRDLPPKESARGAGLQDMYAATRAAGFGAEVRRRILIGTYVLSAGFYDAYYTQAQKVRTLISRDFMDAFQTVDVILAPTAPTAAFGLGEMVSDPLAMYLNDVFAVPASLAGLPAMSVPAGLDRQGLPLGLQLIGRPFDEQGVLDAGLAIEARAGFTARPAKWW
ncbi:glutamyl-tRNA amidotransferase [Novosphingobium fuchskuhlense]|uniref:Glutamyl-tRNA(Gln) amidotransferase subunit A n=1 Tax=Novosphingobium fuchskuhlense TaxID=1117702 RepID=A0A117USJ7_9SPHN|nr:Asp-tRNA(Asn)/Glu-tRNA(Gln) amidotransferase subunit GatA [Novosphingobium fuchskuhlense]KUR70075.1 glutamyl-tRNA amidotransferase [Novosphingobium fuchskuhlense]